MNPPVAELHLRAERAPFVMLPRWLLYHPQVGEGAKRRPRRFLGLRP